MPILDKTVSEKEYLAAINTMAESVAVGTNETLYALGLRNDENYLALVDAFISEMETFRNDHLMAQYKPAFRAPEPEDSDEDKERRIQSKFGNRS